MNIKKFNLTDNDNKSFHVRRDSYPKHHNLWHYHDEVEFIYVAKGEGTLFVGDCIKTISPNCAVLIGPEIPHYWLFHEDYLCEDNPIDCTVIHFKTEFLGEYFFKLDEVQGIKNLIKNSSRALYLNICPTELAYLFESIHSNSQNILKITKLLEALYVFKHESLTPLISEKYAIMHHSEDQKRMNAVIKHIKDHYHNKVELDTLASIAGMTKNSFCRYFKQKTGKTPIEFVSEVRIAYACRLLKSTDMKLKEICYESGFNSFVNFHKIFKNIMNTSPNQYRKHNLEIN